MTIWWALMQLRYHKSLLTAAVGLGTLTILTSIGQMSTSGYLISQAALRPPILDLMLAIVAVRFFGLARAGVRYAERLVSHDLTFRLLSRLRRWMYERLEPIIPSRRIAYHSGDLLSRLVSDIETLQNLYLRVVSPMIVAGIIAATTTFFLWLLDPWVALALLSGLALCGIGLPLATRRLARWAARRQVSIRAMLQQHLIDTVGAMEEMLTLGVEETRLRAYEQMTSELTFLQRQHARIGAWHSFAGNLLTWATMMSVLLLSIPRIQTGEFSGVYLAAAVFGVLASFEAVQPLPAAYQHLEQASSASQRIHEIIEERPEIVDAIAPVLVSVTPSYAFRGVTFTYPGMVRPALLDSSFDLPFRTKVAIVGPSGSGKSTIVNLLCRFFDPQEGKVLLDDRNLSEYSIQNVRAQLAVVLQLPHIFNTTIRENLLLARPEATDAELLATLEDVGLSSFVQSLPSGLNSIPGSEGLMLSGGQRQRLALAQALLKRANILVLDEATANLDPATERDVFDRLSHLTTERTLIVITHRPENLSSLDAVFRLRDGRLEIG
jgi:ATP-binding cassette, subfamily C, bacterial CydC